MMGARLRAIVRSAAAAWSTGLRLTVLVAGLTVPAARVRSTPLDAAREGLPCSRCHFDPGGGGPRNAFGFEYEKNRHSQAAETRGMFQDPALRNRVADALPLFFGVDHRFMALAEDLGEHAAPGGDRSGFTNMETALGVVFQPRDHLTLLYTTDGLDGLARVTREAWGMLGGQRLYVRAGRFRVPFGLRLDDHTVATRRGFLDFQPLGGTVLPYDPRGADAGLELGGARGPGFARLAWTNGAGSPLFDGIGRAQTISGVLGRAGGRVMTGLSGYDEREPVSGFGTRTRASRWGWYGGTHAGRWAWLGEIVAGTDRVALFEEITLNRLAFFAETDYRPDRILNLRVRFDRMELNRSSNIAVRRQGMFNRYAFEGEVAPVPFTQIRWSALLIDPVAARNFFGTQLDLEKQAYVQFQFVF